MTLTMDVALVANKEHLGFVRKEYETSILPYEGLEIEDSAWKDSKKVLSVVASYQNNYIYIALEPYDVQKSKHLNQVKEMFQAHGWVSH
ncbi:MAG: hypothetical protein K9J16_08200 [Melioribacteraceae bacterium]|nr:hypothetical protein [Melioribacteraceae bacterium]MCF8353884.1 hypothetical protein [Melioribacteraceae bacterium]MCF8393117.1 hypothetical protein [Melioribacteraceae bacterium]MCF8419236.1 hypothetical protein [Melioribacteraceae bacterium]